MLPHLSSLLTENITMRNNPGEKEPGLCILGITSKNMQKYSKARVDGLSQQNDLANDSYCEPHKTQPQKNTCPGL